MSFNFDSLKNEDMNIGLAYANLLILNYNNQINKCFQNPDFIYILKYTISSSFINLYSYKEIFCIENKSIIINPKFTQSIVNNYESVNYYNKYEKLRIYEIIPEIIAFISCLSENQENLFKIIQSPYFKKFKYMEFSSEFHINFYHCRWANISSAINYMGHYNYGDDNKFYITDNDLLYAIKFCGNFYYKKTVLAFSNPIIYNYYPIMYKKYISCFKKILTDNEYIEAAKNVIMSPYLIFDIFVSFYIKDRIHIDQLYKYWLSTDYLENITAYDIATCFINIKNYRKNSYDTFYNNLKKLKGE